MGNRQKLLNNALELFSRYGYEAVGVQRIAESADVTKPTLYHYFGSKGGLLSALLNTYFDNLFHEIQYASAYNGDLTLTLQRIIAAYFTFAERNPAYYRLQLALSFTPIDSEAFLAVARLNDRQQILLETLFIQATRDHGNMRDRHRAYAASLSGMINSFIALGLNKRIELNKTLVLQATHQFMHGILS